MKLQDVLIWGVVVLITATAFFGNYYFNFPAAIKAVIWICWLLLVVILGYFTTIGKQAFAFANASKAELQKVVWPTRQETIQTTTIVMAMVTLTGFILWGIDSGMMWVIGKITHLG